MLWVGALAWMAARCRSISASWPLPSWMSSECTPRASETCGSAGGPGGSLLQLASYGCSTTAAPTKMDGCHPQHGHPLPLPPQAHTCPSSSRLAALCSSVLRIMSPMVKRVAATEGLALCTRACRMASSRGSAGAAAASSLPPRLLLAMAMGALDGRDEAVLAGCEAAGRPASCVPGGLRASAPMQRRPGNQLWGPTCVPRRTLPSSPDSASTPSLCEGPACSLCILLRSAQRRIRSLRADNNSHSTARHVTIIRCVWASPHKVWRHWGVPPASQLWTHRRAPRETRHHHAGQACPSSLCAMALQWHDPAVTWQGPGCCARVLHPCYWEGGVAGSAFHHGQKSMRDGMQAKAGPTPKLVHTVYKHC